MSQYETQLSGVTKSIGAIVSMVKDGSAIGNSKDFGYHIWNVQGYLQSVVLGQPTGQDILVAARNNADSQRFHELEKLECLQEFSSMQVYGADDASKLNPIQIFNAVKMVLEMLAALGVFKPKPNPLNADLPDRDPDTGEKRPVAKTPVKKEEVKKEEDKKSSTGNQLG